MASRSYGRLLGYGIALLSVLFGTAATTNDAEGGSHSSLYADPAASYSFSWFQNPLLNQRTKGDPTAPVTIYEVTDFGCPWCREFYRLVLPSIESEYIATGKAKLIFVNLPLPSLHPNSPAAHEFAMCAAKQDRFWPVHDLLYQHQAAWTPLESPRAYFTLLADSAGLDLDSLDICFDTGATRWIVQQEAESVAQQANITSTPSFIMETVMLAGYHPIEDWRPILDSLFAAKTGGNGQLSSSR
jgi:protein-disulfide isomerase